MTDTNTEYMTPARFASKVEWEGGVQDALDYGLKATDLDPEDPNSRELREAWGELERIYREQYQPAERKVDDILDGIETDDEDDE